MIPDVLFGAVLGVVTAFAVCWLLDRIYRRISGNTTEESKNSLPSKIPQV